MINCVKCKVDCSKNVWHVGNRVSLCLKCYENHKVISKDVSCEDYFSWCNEIYFNKGDLKDDYYNTLD